MGGSISWLSKKTIEGEVRRAAARAYLDMVFYLLGRYKVWY